jgi:hypothetical protein
MVTPTVTIFSHITNCMCYEISLVLNAMYPGFVPHEFCLQSAFFRPSRKRQLMM